MRSRSADTPSSSRLEVECYAGYRGEQTPRRFVLLSRCFEVDELLDCWLGPGHRYFKVLADDGGVYTLCQDTRHDSWELTMFAKRRYADGREPVSRDAS